MLLRRLISVSSVVVVATGAALAQPAPADPPAPDGAADGTAVTPIDDEPPADMEGRDENPEAPRGTVEESVSISTGPTPSAPTGYPIELAHRPITLPANMAEVSIAPHFVASPYAGTDALRARYGITPRIQLGLTYVLYGVYDRQDVDIGLSEKYQVHPGKAGGLDVTYLITNWVGVKVGLPVYLDPFAMSVSLGAPMRFRLTDRLTVGGLDDLLNIALPVGAEFAPTYYHERTNAIRGFSSEMSGTVQSAGVLRISAYAIYQQRQNLAIVGSFAQNFEDFSGTRTDAGGGSTSQIYGGAVYSPKKFLDVGGTIGFDDLAQVPDSFALSGFLAVRI